MRDHMDKKLRFFFIAGFIFTGLLGTLLHFTYAFSGKNPVAGLFSPVSESTWEHLKMLYFPAFIWCIPGSFFFYRSEKRLLPACTFGICAGLLTIVCTFYSYTGILGFHLPWFDIMTFFFGAFSLFYTASRYLKRKVNRVRKWHICVSVFILLLLFLCFICFTLYQPPIGLFAEP